MRNDIISVGKPECKVIVANIGSAFGDIMQFPSWRDVKKPSPCIVSLKQGILGIVSSRAEKQDVISSLPWLRQLHLHNQSETCIVQPPTAFM